MLGKGKLSRKRGQRFSSHTKKDGSTQMSNMKGIVDILWNCHVTVHYAAYIKEVYELSKAHIKIL